MNKYELLYICEPTLTEDKREALDEKIKKYIGAGGGEIDAVDEWGTRRLSYPIKKFEEGRYVLVTFKSNPGGVPALDKQIRLLAGVLRHVLLRKEK